MPTMVLTLYILSSSGSCETARALDARLECAQNAFQFGDYAKVVRALRDPLERGVVWPTRADHVEALRIYGISLFLTQRKKAAGSIFQELVRLDPTVRLDPHLVPPEVVLAFNRVRKKILLAQIRRASKPVHKTWVWNMFPPGGQFQNGQYLKGGLILGAEMVLVALNLTSYFLLERPAYRNDGSFVVQDTEGRIIEDHRTLAKALMGLNYASIALLVGTVVYGIVDGWLVYKAQKQARERRRRFLEHQLGAESAGSSAMFTLHF